MTSRLAPMVVLGWLAVSGAAGATTNDLTDAEIQGRRLARQILEQQQPATNFTQTGVLKIRDAKGSRTNIPVRFEIAVTRTNWMSVYEFHPTPGATRRFIIQHNGLSPGQYWMSYRDANTSLDAMLGTNGAPTGEAMMLPFAGSDFGLGDLGLEFLHWPEQKLLKRVVRSSRGCSVLESLNPVPATTAYSRVVSWIDSESLGPLHAEAYDAKGNKLKEYDTKKLRKVNGQWQAESLEIDNVQTGSRTVLVFDLKPE